MELDMHRDFLKKLIIGCLLPMSSQAALIDLSGATATAGSTYLPATPTHQAVNAIDGDFSTSWNAGAFGADSSLTYIDIDLQDIYSLDVVNLYLAVGGNTYNLSTRTSTSDAWSLFASGGAVAGWNTVTGSAIGRYIRYDVYAGTEWAHLTEITLDGASVSPVPVPAAVWLFGAGLISLAGVARRKV